MLIRHTQKKAALNASELREKKKKREKRRARGKNESWQQKKRGRRGIGLARALPSISVAPLNGRSERPHQHFTTSHLLGHFRSDRQI